MPQPLFFHAINYVPPIEVALHRGLWSFIFLFFILLTFTKLDNFYSIFLSPKKLIILSTTAILISINWTGFIYAVSINKVQDASMGYFITPMISICLGYLFINEKITYLKILSVFLMFCSIIFLFITIKSFPYIALIIGTTWGIYGLLRKKINVPPETGLLYECFIITLFSFPYLFYIYINKTGFFLNYNSFTSTLLVLTGLVTIFPLFFFNLGLKKIPLGLTGVLFYLAHTFHFITSIFILNEKLNINKLIAFIIIWLAIIIFIYDVLTNENKINENNTQLLN